MEYLKRHQLFNCVFGKGDRTHELHVLNAQYWRGKPLEDLEREGFPPLTSWLELAARVGYFLQPEAGTVRHEQRDHAEYCFASCSRFNSCVHGCTRPMCGT